MNAFYTRLRQLPFSKFDEDGWLKPSLLIFLNLAILAKGLILFIGALASRQTGAKILEALYPDKHDLYIALLLSVVPFIAITLLTVGKVSDYIKIKRVLFVGCFALWFWQIIELGLDMTHIYKPFESYNFVAIIAHAVFALLLIMSFQSRAYLKQVVGGNKLVPDDEEHD